MAGIAGAAFGPGGKKYLRFSLVSARNLLEEALERNRWNKARVARECVTILKGDWRTMRVVHRPADNTTRVRLDGAATVAVALARVLRAA